MSSIEEVEPKYRLLPHEVEMIRSRLSSFAEIQRKHGEQLGEAMSQGAETFHDNSPAESVRDSQEIVVYQAMPLLDILRNHVAVEYPEPDASQIVLGTRAEVSIGGSEAFMVDIVGYRSGYRDDSDIERISLESPLAQAIIGKKTGDTFKADLGSSQKDITIVSIDQEALRQTGVEKA